MSWLEVVALPVGMLLAWAAVAIIDRITERRVDVLALALVGAALCYLLAALVRGDASALFRESIGVAVFASIAVLGARRAPVLVAIGWGLHIAWDLGMQAWAEPVLPLWYAVGCLGFDAVVAWSLLAHPRRAGRERSRVGPPNRAIQPH